MFTGVPPNQHGVTGRGSTSWDPWDVQGASKSYGNTNDIRGTYRPKKYGHFFRYLKRASKTTASSSSWNAINDLLMPGEADHKFSGNGRDQAVTADVEKILKKDSRPDAIIVQLDAVDHAGHEHGYGGRRKVRAVTNEIAKYVDAMAVADKQVGRILTALKKHPKYGQEDWLTLLVTDHGGSEVTHGENIVSHRRIFIIAHGSSVAGKTIPDRTSIYNIVPEIFRHMRVKIPEHVRQDGTIFK